MVIYPRKERTIHQNRLSYSIAKKQIAKFQEYKAVLINGCVTGKVGFVNVLKNREL